MSVNPYEECPVFEDERYLLRLVEPGDAEALLKVYSDEKAVPLFNSDNCHGDDFHYTTLERMAQAIEFWLKEYADRGFVRWSIIDKSLGYAVGTIELFNRFSHVPTDYFNDCGILRLDLRSDYEKREEMKEILALILPEVKGMFQCRMVATKVMKIAEERRAAVEALGFERSVEVVRGHEGMVYGGYFVLE